MELTDLGSRPSSPGLPAGVGLADLPEFEALEGEIGKLASVSVPGGIDWERVIQLASGLLDGRAKDLKVTGYLCAALAHTRGQEGLALGMHIYRDLLEGYWNDMTPPLARMRGRRNAVEWLAERIAQAAAEWQPVCWPGPRRAAFLADFQAIDGFLANAMEDAPNLRPLLQRAAGWVEEEQEAVPEPAAALPEAPAATGRPLAAAAQRPLPEAQCPMPAPPLPSLENPRQLLDQTQEYLARVAGLLQDQNPADPAPYVLNRMAAWLGVSGLPPAEAGRTRIPAPAAPSMEALDAARAAGNWPRALAQAESLVPVCIFWLDLSRTAAESLATLGWGSAARAVERETRGFAQRMAGLENLCFADGTPFADDATRLWLREPTGAVSEAAVDDATGQALAEARRLAGAGELTQALALVVRQSRASASGRGAFQCKIALCGLLARNPTARVAEAVARDLLLDLEQFQVHRWEPPLASEALQAVLTALRARPEDRDEALIATTIGRLALVDPVLALSWV